MISTSGHKNLNVNAGIGSIGLPVVIVCVILHIQMIMLDLYLKKQCANIPSYLWINNSSDSNISFFVALDAQKARLIRLEVRSNGLYKKLARHLFHAFWVIQTDDREEKLTLLWWSMVSVSHLSKGHMLTIASNLVSIIQRKLGGVTKHSSWTLSNQGKWPVIP
jgi:hypothetical protein